MRIHRSVLLLASGCFAWTCSVVNAPDAPLDNDDDGGGGVATSSSTTGGAGGSGATGGGPSCGDGNIDPAETCDPPASCPTDCDDMDACTLDNLVGDPNACNVMCQNAQIMSCGATADGCCPMGCSGTTDADCSVCGDNMVELGETCDPPNTCVTDCDDMDACTADTLIGAPMTCDTECSNAVITMCVNADGCCPSTCTENNDTDCAREEYSHNFPNGSLASSSVQCTDWIAFKAALVGQFSAVTIRGSNDTTGFTCNVPASATQICNALNTNSNTNVSCNGRFFNVGACGNDVEINTRTAGTACSCANPDYTLRPCINNSNWGGINTDSCGAPTQRMEVICFR